jgi:hypothetical protein
MTTATVPVPIEHLAARAGMHDAETRARGCSRPIRLVGSTTRVNKATGEVLGSYRSGDELDGHTYVRCQNRRASVCPSCSREYKGDAWHLLTCGLAGGKSVPESVASHPATFATLTAPSFGPVHGRGRKGPCRARRDRPVCPHGRPLSCLDRHGDQDRRLGQPLCWQCYDYAGHVLWQWHAPELWRRFTITLARTLAARCGLSPAQFRRRARVAYTKVVEFQARGIIHVHAPIRLDGPHGPDSPPLVDVDADQLGQAVLEAAQHVQLTVPTGDGNGVGLRWGAQVDVRPISHGGGRDASAGPAHPHQVAAYLAKYLTKTTEEFGLPARVSHPWAARQAGASPHAQRIIDTAYTLALRGEAYGRLRDRLATLGYRGHPITKSRHYSTTFGALRRARAAWRRRPPRLDPDAEIRELLDDIHDAADAGVLVVKDWRYAGRGYLDLPTAAAAVTSAVLARTRRGTAGLLGPRSEGGSDGQAAADGG